MGKQRSPIDLRHGAVTPSPARLFKSRASNLVAGVPPLPGDSSRLHIACLADDDVMKNSIAAYYD